MKIKFLSIFITMTLITAPGLCTAQVLSTFVREQIGALPQGRFMVSMVGVYSGVDRMFGQSGNQERLVDHLNQSVSFGKITTEESVRGNQLAGMFLSQGLSLDESAGQIDGTLSGTVSGKVPVIGYGLTDTLGIFLSIPILEFNIQTQYRFSPSASTQKYLSDLRNSDQTSVAREFEAAFQTSLENKLNRSQYDWNPDLNRSYLGDLQVTLFQYMDHRSVSGNEFALQPFVVLPTANDQDLRDLYGLRAGDRRLGLGLKSSAQRRLFANLQGNVSVMGTFLFPTSQGRRLPVDGEDELKEWQDANTQISGGAKLASQAQIRYPFPRWLGLNLGLEWQFQTQENWTGDAVPSTAYREGSERTGYELWSAYASLDLNSIPSFLSGDFLIPVIAELGVGLPLRGRNAVAEPVVQIQGTLFF